MDEQALLFRTRILLVAALVVPALVSCNLLMDDVNKVENYSGSDSDCDSSMPCCDEDGVLLSSDQECSSVIEYQCDGTGCGALAQERTIVTNCSGASEACDGAATEGEWGDITSQNCDADTVCVADAEGAICSACDTGCNDGVCVHCPPTNGNCTADFCEDVVYIPEGIYPRGSSIAETTAVVDPTGCVDYLIGNPTPMHEVKLDSFCMEKYEVTWDRYEECMNSSVCPTGPNDIDMLIDHTNHAMNTATYEKAVTYCEWIGARVCTEAEWERVANGPGPTKLKYPWGSYPDNVLTDLDDYTFFDQHVDEYPTSAISVEGVYNLIKSTFEIVSDFYDVYPNLGVGEFLENPEGPGSGTFWIARGGARSAAPDGSEFTTYERAMLPIDGTYDYW